MTKMFITSDLHFGHANIMKFNPNTRPFSSVEEMNESMIKDYNSVVMPDDTVYILGDVAFMSPGNATTLVNRLNGKKILIRGNHDSKLLTYKPFRDAFHEVHIYFEMYFKNTKVCMFHYPIAEFNQQHRGAVHFHGHLHGAPSGIEHYRVVDVSMDATGNVVSSFEDMFNLAIAKTIKGHGSSNEQ